VIKGLMGANGASGRGKHRLLLMRTGQRSKDPPAWQISLGLIKRS
jgi:hypothetical protein